MVLSEQRWIIYGCWFGIQEVVEVDGSLSERRFFNTTQELWHQCLDDFMRSFGRLVLRATLGFIPCASSRFVDGLAAAFPWRTGKNCRSPVVWFVCLSNSLLRQKHDKYPAFCKSANIDGIRPHDTVGCNFYPRGYAPPKFLLAALSHHTEHVPHEPATSALQRYRTEFKKKQTNKPKGSRTRVILGQLSLRKPRDDMRPGTFSNPVNKI